MVNRFAIYHGQDFAERVQEALSGRPLKDLERRTGISRNSLKKLEYGESVYLNTFKLLALCEECGGISPTWLLTGKGPKYHKELQ